MGLMLAATAALAQKITATEVPAAVQAGFNKKFSGATAVKWEKEKANYEANFKEQNKKTSVLLDANGNWLETETAIEVNALPAAATAYIAKHYAGEKIKEAALIKKANGDSNYEAEVKGMDLLFDQKGQFVKTVKD